MIILQKTIFLCSFQQLLKFCIHCWKIVILTFHSFFPLSPASFCSSLYATTGVHSAYCITEDDWRLSSFVELLHYPCTALPQHWHNNRVTRSIVLQKSKTSQRRFCASDNIFRISNVILSKKRICTAGCKGIIVPSYNYFNWWRGTVRNCQMYAFFT